MSVTSKSPRAVALEALAVAEQALPLHWHKFSPKVFTVAQLFACLVLKAFFRTDYRGIVAILRDLPDLTSAIGLRRVPHFTTLQKNAGRLFDFGPANQLLQASVKRQLGQNHSVELAAADSTGMESSQVSPYFVRRRCRGVDAANPLYQTTTYTRFPKLQAVCDCSTHLVLARTWCWHAPGAGGHAGHRPLSGCEPLRALAVAHPGLRVHSDAAGRRGLRLPGQS